MEIHESHTFRALSYPWRLYAGVEALRHLRDEIGLYPPAATPSIGVALRNSGPPLPQSDGMRNFASVRPPRRTRGDGQDLPAGYWFCTRVD